MERRLFVTGASLAAGASLLSACGKKEEAAPAAVSAPAVADAAQLRWRLTSAFPKSLDTIYGASDTFAAKVSAMSGGKFQISVHAAGELVPTAGLVDAVQEGTVEMGHTASYYYFGKNDCFALGCAIPFGLNSRQMTAWQYDGNGLKLMREFYSNYGFLHFPMGNTGAQMGGWYRKPIRSMADMKGLKFRVGGFAGKVTGRMGAVSQNIPGGEIYQALEKGTIDAAEWVGPYDDQKLGFFKVAPFYHYPGWWEGGPQLDLYVNQKAYDTLSAEYKAIIESAAAFAHTEMQAKYDARNPQALRELVANKTQLVPMPRDVMDTAFKESMALYDEIGQTNADWKKIYTDYSNFRREANQWFRFTEALFDSYMQRAKL
jgi:TRAP-type mannitol/chloroaromatic compound transport system substrate-binding protein